MLSLNVYETIIFLPNLRNNFNLDEVVKSPTDGYVKSFTYKAWRWPRREDLHVVYPAAGRRLFTTPSTVVNPKKVQVR